jgi:hypothetical protein
METNFDRNVSTSNIYEYSEVLSVTDILNNFITFCTVHQLVKYPL